MDLLWRLKKFSWREEKEECERLGWGAGGGEGQEKGEETEEEKRK